MPPQPVPSQGEPFATQPEIESPIARARNFASGYNPMKHPLRTLMRLGVASTFIPGAPKLWNIPTQGTNLNSFSFFGFRSLLTGTASIGQGRLYGAAAGSLLGGVPGAVMGALSGGGLARDKKGAGGLTKLLGKGTTIGGFGQTAFNTSTDFMHSMFAGGIPEGTSAASKAATGFAERTIGKPIPLYSELWQNRYYKRTVTAPYAIAKNVPENVIRASGELASQTIGAKPGGFVYEEATTATLAQQKSRVKQQVKARARSRGRKRVSKKIRRGFRKESAAYRRLFDVDKIIEGSHKAYFASAEQSYKSVYSAMRGITKQSSALSLKMSMFGEYSPFFARGREAMDKTMLGLYTGPEAMKAGNAAWIAKRNATAYQAMKTSTKVGATAVQQAKAGGELAKFINPKTGKVFESATVAGLSPEQITGEVGLGAKAGLKSSARKQIASATRSMIKVAIAAKVIRGVGRIAGGAVRGAISTLETGSAIARQIGKAEFGSGRALVTKQASTERSRAIMAIQNSGINARQYLGREALMYAE